MATVGFPLAYVGAMHLDHGDVDGADAVGEGDGGVGVSARIHDDAIKMCIGLLQFVDEAPYEVRLVIVQLVLGELCLQMLEIDFK